MLGGRDALSVSGTTSDLAMTSTINAEALLRHTSDGAAVVGPDGRIQFWNKAAEQIFSRPAADVVGRHCWSIFGGCDVHGNRVCMSPCMVRILLGRGEGVRHFRMESKTRRGDAIWIDVSTLRDPGGSGRPSSVVHLFRDVTAQHRAEATPIAVDVPERQARAVRRAASDTPPLTTREQEILELLRTGATTATLASQLGITRATVRNHVQNIFGKLGVHSRLAAVTQHGAARR
jgi:PAS domain S-box-containing protein